MNPITVMEMATYRDMFEVSLKLRHNFTFSFAPVMNLAKFNVVRVPISVEVKREGEGSDDYMVTLTNTASDGLMAVYTKYSHNPQWFARASVYREVLAQAYEYSEPRLGMSRWPTLSETANHLLFNLTEGSENQVPTVPARIKAQATVSGEWAARDTVVVERMADGQWRVAGYGRTRLDELSEIELTVTGAGTVFALAQDDYGIRFVPGLSVTVGQRVRPTQYAGWVYEITEAGELPAQEPVWWAAQGENVSRPVGTSMARPVRYFRPLAHGPVTVEMI